MAHPVDPDEADAYWVARGNRIVPPAESWYPPRPPLRRDFDLSREVEFRISKYGECADNPPEGYFTCYEAYLFRCRLWFPIPVIIFENLNRFELSISQVALAGLQHLIGILVLSYERGMKLDIDRFEALLRPKLLPGSLMYCLVPFLNPLPLFPEDLVVLRDLLRGGSFHGTYFTTKRIRRALACHRSQAHPQGFVEDETDSDMDDFASCDVPKTRERGIGSRRTKRLHLTTLSFPRMSFCYPDGIQTLFPAMGAVPEMFPSWNATSTISSPRSPRTSIHLQPWMSYQGRKCLRRVLD
uniref:Uncharacterized protein n=1 Tax=Brassica oleracea TaxID=3712 RepID=A0A3P6BL58_BRAOL|nr:unnamed protein product [Brassica oleracea]